MVEQQDSKNSGKLPYKVKEELISRPKLSDEEKAAKLAVLIKESFGRSDSDLRRSLTSHYQHASLEIARTSRLVQDTVLPKALFDYSQLIGQVSRQIEPVREALKQIVIPLTSEVARTVQRVSAAYGALTIPPQFPKTTSNTILQDIFDVHEHADREAARRLAERIQWRPGGRNGHAIALRAKVEGKSFDSLITEALTEGIMQVVPCIGSRLPLFLHNSPYALSMPDGELITTNPMEWTPSEVWEWLRQETVRAAGMWLFEIPYTSAVMLESPPSEDGSFDFAIFAMVDALALPTAPLRGRPFGSGTFASREEFLFHVGQAVQDVRGKGNKATQIRVAREMAFRNIFGLANPSRQLRYWTNQFGFLDWRDLLNNL